nr:Os08g0131150 [Ipomoea trifida]
MALQARPSNSEQGCSLRHGHPIHLIRVDIFRPQPLRRAPVKAVKQPGQSHQHQRHAQGGAGALPLPGAERQDLEVGAMADLHAAAVGREMPLRVEVVHVVPHAGVAPQAVGVDEDAGLGGDVVAVDGGGARGLVRDEERPRRVGPEGFAYHAAEVVEVDQIVLGDHSVGAHHLVQLCLDFLEDAWPLDHLRHCPFPKQMKQLVSYVHEFHGFLRSRRLISPKKLFPQQHPRHIVHRESPQNLPQVHCLPILGHPENILDQMPGLLGAVLGEGVEALGGQQMLHADPPHPLPLGAHGSQRHVAAAVRQVNGGESPGARGEDLVLLEKYFADDGGVVSGNGVDAAQTEVHQRPVFVAEGGEVAVGKAAQLEKVADDGPPRRPRGKPLAVFFRGFYRQ